MDAKTKDSIAIFLHDNYDEDRLYNKPFYLFTAEGFTEDETVKAMRRLHKLGLLKDFKVQREGVSFIISPDLEEFLELGGYTAKQKILEMEKAEVEAHLQYLYLQIKECEKRDATLFHNLTVGFNNLAGLFGLGVSYFG